MSENELKPCPHCGGKAVYTSVDGYPVVQEDSVTAWCRCVQHNGGTVFYVDFWNTRPIEDALHAENTRLVDLLNRILQPGIEWIRMINDPEATGDDWVAWMEKHGDECDLYRARMIEAMKEAAKPKEGKGG